MFNVKITHEQKLYAWWLVNEHNFGRRGDFDGDRNRQYVGMLGQTVMADLLYRNGFVAERPEPTEGHDNGIDFVLEGMNVDLKTMSRKVWVRPYFVNNLVASQLKSDTDVYCFASIRTLFPTTMQFLGIIHKRSIDEFIIPKGTKRMRSDGTSFETGADLIEIPVKKLVQVKNIVDLVHKVGAMR